MNEVVNFICYFVNILTKKFLELNKSVHYKIVNNYDAKC